MFSWCEWGISRVIIPVIEFCAYRALETSDIPHLLNSARVQIHRTPCTRVVCLQYRESCLHHQLLRYLTNRKVFMNLEMTK